MKSLDRIIEVLNDLSDYELIDVHNRYCENNNYMDDYIEYMSEIDCMFSGMSATEFLSKIDFDNFDVNNNYFVYTIYGLVSFDYVDDDNCPICIDEIASYILNNSDDLECSEIADCLEEIEETHEIVIYLNDNNGVYSDIYQDIEADYETTQDIIEAFKNDDIKQLKTILNNSGDLPLYDGVKATENLSIEIDGDTLDYIIMQGE